MIKEDMKINGVSAEYELPCIKASGGCIIKYKFEKPRSRLNIAVHYYGRQGKFPREQLLDPPPQSKVYIIFRKKTHNFQSKKKI